MESSQSSLRSRLVMQDQQKRSLAQRFSAVRARSVALAKGLSDADMTAQSMPDASPTKWHLAHTTWFFEVFVLGQFSQNYAPYNPHFAYLFNSYYEALGARHPRPNRGLLSRPSAAEIFDYRAHVDQAMCALLSDRDDPQLLDRVVLGLNHEQQHQELLLTDILHLFAQNPLKPAYCEVSKPLQKFASPALQWTSIAGGEARIGHQGKSFAFDCEGPAHAVLLQPYKLANRLITNGEWMEFIADGAYSTPGLWLSDGWSEVQSQGWNAPLYWQQLDGEWQSMSLFGMRSVDLSAPVAHVSYFEADAFATWAGKRLPRESEWEAMAQLQSAPGNLADSNNLQPLSACGSGMQQMFGDVWEWTQSPFTAYPGFRPASGAVGEYNGKFMNGQYVLRGGSCVTPAEHIRASYRNFFYPHQRWQFCGLRLAEDDA